MSSPADFEDAGKFVTREDGRVMIYEWSMGGDESLMLYGGLNKHEIATHLRNISSPKWVLRIHIGGHVMADLEISPMEASNWLLRNEMYHINHHLNNPIAS